MESSENRLSPCPKSPNCVSSLSKNPKHAIEPLHYRGSQVEARQRLIEILENTKRVRVILAEPNYIHAEARSHFFKFVDDVEFVFPEEENIIHLKSASRIGYSDLGANRKRIERIRRDFDR